MYKDKKTTRLMVTSIKKNIIIISSSNLSLRRELCVISMHMFSFNTYVNFFAFSLLIFLHTFLVQFYWRFGLVCHFGHVRSQPTTNLLSLRSQQCLFICFYFERCRPRNSDLLPCWWLLNKEFNRDCAASSAMKIIRIDSTATSELQSCKFLGLTINFVTLLYQVPAILIIFILGDAAR